MKRTHSLFSGVATVLFMSASALPCGTMIVEARGEQNLPSTLKVERGAATEALKNVDKNAAIADLLKALKVDDASVRDAAIEALKKVDKDAAIADLMKALVDDDATVRDAAIDDLEKLDQDEVIDPQTPLRPLGTIGEIDLQTPLQPLMSVREIDLQ